MGAHRRRFDAVAFLAVMAVLWVGALPAFLDARDGIPIGSGLYTIACFVGAAAVLAVHYTGRRRAVVMAG